LPDYYLIYNGVSIWIELKREGKKPRKLQSYVLKQLCNAGALTLATDDFSEVENLVNEIVK
jgi:hypothetical protein